jgi:two-component system sensor histidine kinase KdpD
VQLELEPFIQTIADAFGVVSAAHEIVAEVDAGVFVSVDPAPLYQVLGHLLDNAIKYSPGGALIRIRVRQGEDELSIDVVDDGTGVPEGIDIFEPFRRGDSGPEARPGIGLGLHIVRNLVLAMGGTVAARRNTPEPGSTTTVHLPARPWAPG